MKLTLICCLVALLGGCCTYGHPRRLPRNHPPKFHSPFAGSPERRPPTPAVASRAQPLPPMPPPKGGHPAPAHRP